MEQLNDLYQLTGFPHIQATMLVMWAIVGVLLYLAVKKEFEPLLLIPIAFGALLANIPSENLLEEPAGDIRASAPSAIVATALHKGETFKIPAVPIEIAEHLARYDDPSDVRKLFQEEHARVMKTENELTEAVKRTGREFEAIEKVYDKNKADLDLKRKYLLAKKTYEQAKDTKANTRGGIIGAILRPAKSAPSKGIIGVNEKGEIENPEKARQQWKEGYSLPVVWTLNPSQTDSAGAPAPVVDKTFLVTRDFRVVSVPATGTVHYALTPRQGQDLKQGTVIASLNNPHVGGLYHFIKLGVLFEIFPPLIFLGIGALTDFGPLIANPKTLLLGAAAQLGVFATFIAAVYLGFSPGEAASIGIIGGADGPTSIFLANKLAPHLMAAIAVAAYSYMALVPMIQPPIMRALTTEHERRIRMKTLRKVGRTEKLVFAIVVTVLCILLVPPVAPLIGMLMLGNFVRESGVTDRLSKMAQNELINIVTIFLGTSVGITMTADRFLRQDTLLILALGVVAFGFSTAGGIWMAKCMNLFLKEKINPLIGSAGVSAVPMAARVSQVEGQKADPTNFLLMHAMGPNVAGVIGSAIAAGFFIAKLGGH
ncbi:MAG: sodium ion-translocating decarboxylase subunit beta [Puniceicoccales bacterium]|jgi:oxaloacetate decarboxylase beta subunit|nr:sodium ion-translocating decarboxylase subunit beta [Puniceicoccales bacterium]